MKRLISLLLAGMLCLAGCHASEAETAAPPETMPEMPTVPAAVQTLPAETEPQESEPVFWEPPEEAFVRVLDYLPEVRQELVYATEQNFTGQRIYEFTDAYLRYGTLKKLAQVCRELEAQGLFLKIWDGFRPVSAQFRLWEVCPNPTYVANPNTGYSSHSRGNTVDLTLVDGSGREIEMPTGFDDFSALADRDYSDCPETAAANARMLQDVMEKYGFTGYFGEWWHFSDTQTYPVEESFEPVAPSRWYADCEEFISLRREPDTAAEVITRIPAQEEFVMLARDGDFALVSYQGQQGYVLRSCLQSLGQEPDAAVPAQ